MDGSDLAEMGRQDTALTPRCFHLFLLESNGYLLYSVYDFRQSYWVGVWTAQRYLVRKEKVNEIYVFPAIPEKTWAYCPLQRIW
jgi:hypothetical protein